LRRQRVEAESPRSDPVESPSGPAKRAFPERPSSLEEAARRVHDRCLRLEPKVPMAAPNPGRSSLGPECRTERSEYEASWSPAVEPEPEQRPCLRQVLQGALHPDSSPSPSPNQGPHSR
jgi:hypothetical protein